MLAQILALFAAVAPAAAPNTISPLTVTGPEEGPPIAAAIEVGGSDDFIGDYVAIWPSLAYQTGANGRVTLSCLVDVHGLAEWCKVASETPKNKGFGRAALQLRPTFKLEPAKGPDGAPVNAVMSINVGFRAPKKDAVGTWGTQAQVRSTTDFKNMARAAQSIAGNPLAMRAVTMLDNPVWAEAAGFEDLALAYPAKGGGVEGYAAAHCMVERSGAQAGGLRHCQIIKETPREAGFGAAALSLTSQFRVATASLAKAPRGAPVWVDIPIRLPPPARIADRTVMAPVWIVSMDPNARPKVFPPEAQDSGVTAGRGVARCTVGPDGSMTACVPEPGEPDGLGFSEAAAKLASTMKMNLWSADGAPVEGGVVHIPIRLNLKD